MRVTVVGAGNIGTQLAVHCAEKGHCVTVYSSKPEKINKHLSIVNEKDEVIHSGEIYKATSDEEQAFLGAELVLVTMPATMMKQNAKKIEPYANEKMKIGLFPGTGGGECAFGECIRKGAVLFGVQRVPSVARLVEYGKCVRAIGYRDEMFVSAIPNRKTEECCQIIQDMVDITTSPLPNYLNITLTPSNPILHTTRLRTLFQDYSEGVVYDRVPLFYEEWNDATSELLFLCDDEVQSLCQQLHPFELSYVRSLKIHYESPTPKALTRKIQSITGFKGLTSPSVQTPNGYIPDFASRYFTADFSYGLSILIQIADLVEMEVPYMKETMQWYRDLIADREEFSFADYGICSLKDFVSFYEY